MCLCLLGFTAKAADQPVERLAELNIRLAELNTLRNSQQIDYPTHATRARPINDEIKRLWQPLRRLPPDEQRRIRSEVQGLTSARLAILEPQWKKQAQQHAAGQKTRQQDLSAALESDARRALEHQRNRLRLQQQRDRGEIDPGTFQSSDAVELAAIQTLRDRYEAEGRMYAQQFDNRLKRLTAALAGDPSTLLPGQRVAAGQGGGTTDTDYAKDVALAADFITKKRDLQNRFEAKAITGDTFRETDVVYSHDLARLMTKWRGVSQQKGAQFERDFTARSRGVTTAAVSAPAPAPARAAKPSFPVGFAAMAFLGLAGGVAFLIFRNRADTSFDSSQFRKPTTHGSASFGHNHPSARDPSAASTGVFLGKVIYQGQERLPLHLPEGARPVFTTPEHHALIVARTRTGKGTRIIIPTLLRYTGSALVIDPKGENAAITARTRRDQLGHAVHIVNPWNVLAPHFEALDLEASTFNPLDVLHRADPNCVAIAQSLAATVCPTSPGDKDRFWQGSAASVLAAVFLWITDRPDERKTLARAREIVTLSRKQFTEKFLVRMAASTAFGGAIRELVSPYLDLADETYSGILSNLNEATKFLSDPQIKAATEASSFDLTDFITYRTTVYFVIPPERIDTQRTWLRLVIAAAMHTFKQNASAGGAADRCQFLIDEFAALGRIEDLPRDIATISGYGVDFTLIIQNLDQLRDIYGEAAAGTILSNCAYKWFCNLNDLATAKYLSECLGQTTVETVSRSTSLNAEGKPSESTSHGETGRPLLSPDQILNLGREAAIALHPYGQPLYLRPVDYWNLTTAFHTLKDKYPALYWNPPLAPDPNPYRR